MPERVNGVVQDGLERPSKRTKAPSGLLVKRIEAVLGADAVCPFLGLGWFGAGMGAGFTVASLAGRFALCLGSSGDFSEIDVRASSRVCVTMRFGAAASFCR